MEHVISELRPRSALYYAMEAVGANLDEQDEEDLERREQERVSKRSTSASAVYECFLRLAASCPASVGRSRGKDHSQSTQQAHKLETG